MKKVITTLIAAAALAGCGGSSDTNTISLPPTDTSTTTAAPNVPEPGPFTGSGTENLGTITVPANTVLHWTCPNACDQGNFIVMNNIQDASQIEVNALGQTSGQTVVDGGVYHDVQVSATGNGWTLTFTQGQ